MLSFAIASVQVTASRARWRCRLGRAARRCERQARYGIRRCLAPSRGARRRRVRRSPRHASRCCAHALRSCPRGYWRTIAPSSQSSRPRRARPRRPRPDRARSFSPRLVRAQPCLTGRHCASRSPDGARCAPRPRLHAARSRARRHTRRTRRTRRTGYRRNPVHMHTPGTRRMAHRRSPDHRRRWSSCTRSPVEAHRRSPAHSCGNIHTRPSGRRRCTRPGRSRLKPRIPRVGRSPRRSPARRREPSSSRDPP